MKKTTFSFLLFVCFAFPTILGNISMNPFEKIETYDFESIQNMEASVKKEKLEEYTAILHHLLPKSENQPLIYYNLSLAHYFQEEYGKALFYLNQIKGQQPASEKANTLMKRIENKIGFQTNQQQQIRNILKGILTFAFLDREQKISMIFILNFLLCFSVLFSVFFRKKSSIYLSVFLVLAVLYQTALLVSPEKFTSQNDAFLISKNMEAYQGPGTYFPKVQLSLTDGNRVKIQNVEKNWIEVDEGDQSFWVQKKDLIYSSK